MQETLEAKVGNPFRLGLLLLGSFTIAYNTAQFLHEASHALAAILFGGYSGGILIHPFNWSYSFSACPEHAIFHVASGAIGSALIALLAYVVLIRWAKAWLLPLLLIGPITFLEGGAYWIVDVLYGSGGDACELIGLGVPSLAVLCTGAILLAVGVAMVFHLMCVIGIAAETFRARLKILLIGISSYSVAGLAWNWFYACSEFTMWLIYFLSETGLVIFVAVFAGLFRISKRRPLSSGWATVIVINLLALGLVITLLAKSSAGIGASSSQLKTFSARPDDFPDVLVPYPQATKATYVLPSSIQLEQGYKLVYSLPEDSDPNQIRDYLTQLYREHGYTRLRYSFDDPHELKDDSWREEVSTVGLKTNRSKQYEQHWIRPIPQVSSSLLSVCYSWRADRFAYAFVSSTEYRVSEIKQLLAYADVHPEAFDPNDIEQLKRNIRPPAVKATENP